MGAAALGLALGAAALHAGWNLLIARARDSVAAGGVAFAAGAVAFLPVLAIAGGHVHSSAAPYLVATVVLELAYLVLLSRAYAGGELSVVYPLARGSAPVLVLAGSAAALGQHPSLAQVLGVALVAAGVLLVRAGGTEPAGRRDLLFGLTIGVCIAGYTVVDARGLHEAAALPYLEIALGVPALANLATLIARGRGAAIRAELTATTIAVGVLAIAAYGLVLLALQRAAAAPVAAVRETSVLIAVLLAGAVLREPVTGRRAAGAASIAAGIAAVALA